MGVRDIVGVEYWNARRKLEEGSEGGLLESGQNGCPELTLKQADRLRMKYPGVMRCDVKLLERSEVKFLKNFSLSSKH